MAAHMVPIELPVLFVPEEEVAMFELGLDYKSKPMSMLFFNINGITPYIDPKGNSYTEILCNGDGYVCPLPYEEVKNMIKWK